MLMPPTREDSLLEVVLEALLDGVAAVDTAGNVLFINTAMAKMLGFADRDAVPDVNIFQALERIEAVDATGRKLPLKERPLVRALGGEAVSDAALRMHQPVQNRFYDVLNSALPILDGNGRVRMAVLRMRDVSEQLRAMKALKAGEERYQLATSAIEAMIYDWNVETGRIVRTDAVEAIVGIPVQEVVAHRSWWLSRVHPSDVDELVSGREAALAAQQPRGVSSYRVRHRDGRWVHVTDRFLALYDESGKPTRIVGSVVDVTRETLAAQALADSEQRYRSLFENASDIVAVLDAGLRIQSVNGAVERILGRAPDDLVGKPLADLLETPKTLPVSPDGFEFTARARNARRDVALEVRGTLLHDGKGERDGLLLIARDVTERKLAEARQLLLMRELQHRTKNLLAVVQSLATHTLRNSTSLAQAHEALLGRLHAVAMAQEFVASEGGGAPLRGLVDGEVAPFPGRTNVDGPDMIVSNAFAQTFTLVIHELVTNSAKYGALSALAGRVEIRWDRAKIETGDVFRFTWTERDGPSVSPPRTAGFGRKIINLLGRPTLDFDPAGVRYRVEVPFAELTQ